MYFRHYKSFVYIQFYRTNTKSLSTHIHYTAYIQIPVLNPYEFLSLLTQSHNNIISSPAINWPKEASDKQM